jgi:hypothetical protein
VFGQIPRLSAKAPSLLQILPQFLSGTASFNGLKSGLAAPRALLRSALSAPPSRGSALRVRSLNARQNHVRFPQQCTAARLGAAPLAIGCRERNGNSNREPRYIAIA